ncbi:hypothetical protein FF1_000270 [Malus domestica]
MPLPSPSICVEEEGEKLRPRLLTTTIVTAGRLSTTTVPSSAAGGFDEPLLPPFDYEPQPYNGPLADQVFQKRNKFLGPSLSIIIRILKMQYLFDENGRRCLDAFAGIVTVSCGHCHPDVLNAIVEQSRLLQRATTIYLHHTRH